MHVATLCACQCVSTHASACVHLQWFVYGRLNIRMSLLLKELHKANIGISKDTSPPTPPSQNEIRGEYCVLLSKDWGWGKGSLVTFVRKLLTPSICDLRREGTRSGTREEGRGQEVEQGKKGDDKKGTREEGKEDRIKR